VAPWLDGRTADDVCERLRAEASPAEVFYVLTQLQRKDYLCEEEPALPAGQAALWSSQQVASRTAVRRLAERPVGVKAFGVEAGPFRDLLESLHVRLADLGPPDVVLTDSALRGELQDCNAAALRGGRPWLLGVLFQTMYLTATAMGLAPCAVGGDADLFARAAGTDYYAETSVGEFLLGNPRPQPVGRVG
jgi:hypothetical protein